MKFATKQNPDQTSELYIFLFGTAADIHFSISLLFPGGNVYYHNRWISAFKIMPVNGFGQDKFCSKQDSQPVLVCATFHYDQIDMEETKIYFDNMKFKWHFTSKTSACSSPPILLIIFAILLWIKLHLSTIQAKLGNYTHSCFDAAAGVNFLISILFPRVMCLVTNVNRWISAFKIMSVYQAEIVNL